MITTSSTTRPTLPIRCGDKHTRLRNQMRRLFGCTVTGALVLSPSPSVIAPSQLRLVEHL